ncbi:hypothetical protein MUO14_06685 [Halobacillus shinanisalinarum]|uniref:Uncharacterized protein n=1 Tax=Halobacillus shinanisalinarum TaxID=2932258 RepID=A0ABY4H2F1_9BACI|nr:hypothetical protein [Halobacillus shinanisalinarum]UOQ94630.1 hypothetical protein MUO14_06685 [Halobacillus shinanisalinarum]
MEYIAHVLSIYKRMNIHPAGFSFLKKWKKDRLTSSIIGLGKQTEITCVKELFISFTVVPLAIDHSDIEPIHLL